MTRSVILPGTISGGMRKLTQDTGKRMCDCELIMERFTEDKKARREIVVDNILERVPVQNHLIARK